MANFRDTLTFRNYDRERLIIDSVAARLTAEENAFRNKIIGYIVDNHRPFAPADAAEKAMVEALHCKNALTIEEDGTVSSIYPVSAKPSHHLVTLADGRTVYCMCAIDALGCAFTFDQDITINSSCSNSGVAIRITIKNKQIEHALPSKDDMRVLHADLKASDLPVKVPVAKWPAKAGKVLASGFKTPTGKFEFYSETIAAIDPRYGLDPLPVYTDSLADQNDPETREKYPFYLCTGARLPFTLHSRIHETPWLRSLRPERGWPTPSTPASTRRRGSAASGPIPRWRSTPPTPPGWD